MVSIAAWTLARSETSQRTESIPSGTPSTARSSATTWAPRSRSSSAVANPIPAPPPVTAATRPANSPAPITPPRRAGARSRGPRSPAPPRHRHASRDGRADPGATPAGVPVLIRSPGSSTMNWLRYQMTWAIGKIMLALVPFCRWTPFTGQGHGEGLRVGDLIGRHEDGAERVEGRATLAQVPLRGALELELALGDVMGDGVAGDVGTSPPRPSRDSSRCDRSRRRAPPPSRSWSSGAAPARCRTGRSPSRGPS